MSSSTSSSDPADAQRRQDRAQGWRAGCAPDQGAWRRFFTRAVATAAISCAVVYAFVAAVDPWGVLRLHIPAERPPISTNARFAFAGLARSDRFDAAIFGTSTMRMLRPAALNEAFGARFANLAMNAATAYEQSRLFDVFLRAHPNPRAMVIGLDHVWCDAGPLQRYTPRAFPEAFYESSPWPAYREMLSFYAVQEAGRQFAVLTGMMRPRYGHDGYTRFLPPEDRYDAARAAANLPALPPPETPRQVDTPPSDLPMPPLALLDRMVRATPADTRLVLVFMPLYLGAQGAPGTGSAAITEACKRQVVAMAQARPGTVVLDFWRASPITREPTNYWDPMHYRDAIAERIEAALSRAARGSAGPSEDYADLTP
ncbi:hypothetical protein AAFN86_14300 [Roseomonas sp. CAU 1739]|uniref:hypothetical protein n=1 Tax=Roseomonas sp. CAU 1739 TaxID=3140364 RepID=UPI00325B35B5